VKGIFSPPRAPRLTPGIDWASDAERTLAESRKMMETREKGEIKSKITIKNKSRSGKVLEAVN
jgi:hypothetical protein